MKTDKEFILAKVLQFSQSLIGTGPREILTQLRHTLQFSQSLIGTVDCRGNFTHPYQNYNSPRVLLERRRMPGVGDEEVRITILPESYWNHHKYRRRL